MLPCSAQKDYVAKYRLYLLLHLTTFTIKFWRYTETTQLDFLVIDQRLFFLMTEKD